jgi:hypothetical protein
MSVLALRTAGNGVQMARFKMLCSGTEMTSASGIKVGAPNGRSPATELPQELLKSSAPIQVGHDRDKWFSFNESADLIFSVPAGTECYGFYFLTANDEPRRDPMK